VDFLLHMTVAPVTGELPQVKSSGVVLTSVNIPWRRLEPENLLSLQVLCCDWSSQSQHQPTRSDGGRGRVHVPLVTWRNL